jgi:hypothetical protein
MMLVENKYNLNEFVLLRSDETETLRIITGILVIPGNVIMYRLMEGSYKSWHFEDELFSHVRLLREEDF